MEDITVECVIKEYGNLSDRELMEYVALKDTDAPQAFTCLYERYKSYVWSIITNRVLKFTSLETAEDLSQQVFLKIWQKADQFGKTNKTPNFKGWIGKISVNVVHDWFTDFQFTDDLDEAYDVVELAEDSADTLERRYFEEALDTLTEREKDIITLYYETHDPRNSQSKTPRILLMELYKKFNISNEGVRQIRHRAKRKIEAFVESRMRGEKT